jgi:hypothetical protein
MTGLVEGGIYAQKQRFLRWGVFKVLKLDPEVAHVRLYKNTFRLRPTAKIIPDLDWSVGHVPISRVNVESWAVQLLAQTPVTPDELQGYEIWREDGGAGYFP